jgi:hypothetical protein
MNTAEKLIFYIEDLVALGYARNKRELYRKLNAAKLPQGTKIGTARNAHREWTRQELIEHETREGRYILRLRPPAGAEPVPLPHHGTIWDADEEISDDPKDLKMMASYTRAVDMNVLAPVLDAALARMKKDWH